MPIAQGNGGHSDILLINQRGRVRRLGTTSSSPKLAKGFDFISLRPERIGLESGGIYRWEPALPNSQPRGTLERAFLWGEGNLVRRNAMPPGG